MSTEIKNTLFRFVTMRAPELLEKDIVDQNFVNHPESNKQNTDTFDSVFLQAANHVTEGISKRKSLSNAATTFALTALKTRESLYESELISKDFYDFAVWLTKNRTKVTAENIYEKTIINEGGFVGPTPRFEPLNNTQLNQLWDNLFYQIVTFKSNYAREVLLTVLVADFFLKNKLSIEQTNEGYQKLAQARVIIPKVIFEKEDTSAQKVQIQQVLEALPVNTKALDKEMDLMMLNQEIESYKTTISELEKAQNVYTKTYQKAHEIAKKAYEATVADLYAKAETKVQVVVDPITNIERTITEYVNLVIPAFEFEKEPELQPALLASKTSQKTTSIVDQLVSANDFETFDEVINLLNEQVDTATQAIFDNSTLTQTMVSSNGMVFPVSNTISEPVFTIGAISFTGAAPLSFLFNDSVNNADVVSANYTITFDDETQVTQTSFTDTIVNGKLMVKTFLNSLSLIDKNSFTVAGVFTLSDGKTINFSGNGNISEAVVGLKIPIDGVTSYSLKGSGKYTVKQIVVIGDGEGDGDTDTGNSDGSVIQYIPSGFGVKRLGIADYRKVEQEVCCYVPGEVSHIENIMAREYKEKATRRLRRSEDTTTTSKETEREKLTDSTSTDRFEMNQEVASVMAEDTSFGAHAGASYSGGNKTAGTSYQLSAGADFANNTSSEESNSQAVTHAKEVTERVLDRVVQKVKEERVSKVIEEFEENNKHGFDNTKGDKHVSGVYRWVDKIYKNQVLNYGKRLMYEFMIPEPATFHNIVVSGKTNSLNGEILIKPVDPRVGNDNLKLTSSQDLTQTNYQHWASLYDASIESYPENTITVGKAFDYNTTEPLKPGSKSEVVQIPEKYTSNKVSVKFEPFFTGDPRWGQGARLTVGSKSIYKGAEYLGGYPIPRFRGVSNPEKIENEPMLGFTGEVPITVASINAYTINGNVMIECVLTQEAKEQWQTETFNTILQAYERKLEEYNQKLKQLNAEVHGTNPMFYRQIENTVLRKNCIEYLASHNALGDDTLKLVKSDGVTGSQVNYENPALESYAAKVKFFEQAFEWNLMSYNFYPFYWADKKNWADLYNTTETNDPVFRAFLQSGMARVIVTARPGFEEAVNWYMATGQIWNGGQVPTMDDPLYISIVDELRETTGIVEETWETRVPTSLTVIQAGSIGLDVQGLPCDEDCADFKLFDSDGQPVLDGNGKQVSTNPIKQSLDANGNDVVLGNTVSDTGNTGGGSGGPGGGGNENPPVYS
jgi:hypothetical protein